MTEPGDSPLNEVPKQQLDAEQDTNGDNDGMVDAIAAAVLVAIAVATVMFWLAGQ